MNLRNVLSAYAILHAVGGLIWLVAPARSLVLYGAATPGPIAVLLGRYAGALAISLAVLAWMARDVAPSPERTTLVRGLTLASAMSAAACLSGALMPQLNAATWVPTAGYLVFTVLFMVAGRDRSAAPVAVPVA